MTVSFTPGPHPDAATRSASSSSIRFASPNTNGNNSSSSARPDGTPQADHNQTFPNAQSPFYPNAPQSSPHTVSHTPLTSSPLSTNFPRKYPRRGSDPDLFSSSSAAAGTSTSTSGRGRSRGRAGDPGDAERQPLLETRELNRERTFWPVLIVLGVVVGLGLMIGFGGWRLGQGEGGGRWPGGPG